MSKMLNKKSEKATRYNLPSEIEILGVRLSKNNFPACYEWALKGGDNLQKSVENILKQEGWDKDKAVSVMIILESDMSHLTNSTEE